MISKIFSSLVYLLFMENNEFNLIFVLCWRVEREENVKLIFSLGEILVLIKHKRQEVECCIIQRICHIAFIFSDDPIFIEVEDKEKFSTFVSYVSM